MGLSPIVFTQWSHNFGTHKTDICIITLKLKILTQLINFLVICLMLINIQRQIPFSVNTKCDKSSHLVMGQFQGFKNKNIST